MKKALLILPILLLLFVVLITVGKRQSTSPGIVVPNAPVPQDTQLKASQNNTQFDLTVFPGFSLETYAKDLAGPRDLEFDPKGSVLVSSPSEGTVIALPDKKVIASGLNRPHGIAFNCQGSNCKLYVAETDKVVTFDYNPDAKSASNKQKILDLPGGGGHFTRSLLITNNKLYISIGSSCNVCVEKDDRRAAIYESDLDGSNFSVFAQGLRNSVFMTKNPSTGEIWATDMGRDLLGDDTPSEEINIISRGKHYGWPYCYENQVQDKNFDSSFERGGFCRTTQTPQVLMQAHSAPLGLAFIPNKNWPDGLVGDLLVAFHGSWNRSVPTGYKIVRVKISDSGQTEGLEDFITGWLESGSGRPVDILLSDEGVGYISDDKAGVVYKLVFLQ